MEGNGHGQSVESADNSDELQQDEQYDPLAGLDPNSDVLQVPQLDYNARVGSAAKPALEVRLSTIESCLLLACAQHVRMSSAQDELQAWQVAPYIEAVLAQAELGEGEGEGRLVAQVRLGLRAMHLLFLLQPVAI